jgi:beta-phosphoglucomutase-like phosphatase (HAD superfamily)
MDGTLVDTEGYWMDAETALVESFGGTWTHEQALTLVGRVSIAPERSCRRPACAWRSRHRRHLTAR